MKGLPAFPLALLDLTNLTGFQFWDNSFDATIPAAIAQMQQLTSLKLFSNGLRGTILNSLTKLTHLMELRLNSNPLINGTLSAFNLSHLTSKYCDLGGIPFKCPLSKGACNWWCKIVYYVGIYAWDNSGHQRNSNQTKCTSPTNKAQILIRQK